MSDLPISNQSLSVYSKSGINNKRIKSVNARLDISNTRDASELITKYHKYCNRMLGFTHISISLPFLFYSETQYIGRERYFPVLQETEWMIQQLFKKTRLALMDSKLAEFSIPSIVLCVHVEVKFFYIIITDLYISLSLMSQTLPNMSLVLEPYSTPDFHFKGKNLTFSFQYNNITKDSRFRIKYVFDGNRNYESRMIRI
jgi:hypothetical protein